MDGRGPWPGGSTGRTRRVVRPAHAPPDDFVVVLALLCVVYLVFALTAAPWAHWFVSAGYLAALFFAVRTSRPSRRMRGVVRVVLVVRARATRTPSPTVLTAPPGGEDAPARWAVHPGVGRPRAARARTAGRVARVRARAGMMAP